MAEEGVKRKLTAIFSADAKGYSRLMGEDEAATVQTLKTYREIMASHIQQHRGRVVDSPGDNLLAEFSSVVDALDCAVKIQNDLKAKNSELPEQSRMDFRIGVNLGDVIEDEERIYGDGVNVAARVEGLADGGGICISGTAYDQIAKKLPLGYEYLGEQTVKNIERPVRVYRVLMDPEAVGKVIGEKRFLGRFSRRTAMAAIIILFIAAGGLISWNIYLQQSKKVEPASVEKMAYPLPEKPSIAVLPFDNLSGDPEQDYLADGFSESIITALSYIPQMFVIARNSSFTYKGKPVKVQQVSEELGVRYIVEGSVLRSGDKVRITVQLIDALSGGHIWSKRFDRDFKDLFDLLDEITLAIAVALHLRLTEGEEARIEYGSTRNLEAWGYAVKARGFAVLLTKEGNAKAREFFDKALEIDPEYAFALTHLAWTYFVDAWFGYTDTPEEFFKRAVELAKRSVAINDKDPNVLGLWQKIYLRRGQHDKAVEEGRKAIALGPNDAAAHHHFCQTLSSSGFFEEAVQMCEKAMRLHPHRPMYFYYPLMEAYYRAGRYEQCLATAELVIDPRREIEDPSTVVGAYQLSAMAHIKLGQESEARKKMAEALKIWPQYSLEMERQYAISKPAIMEQELDVLRKYVIGLFAIQKAVISPTYRYFWTPEKPAIFDFYHNSEG
jgi:adenylate cyclase